MGAPGARLDSAAIGRNLDPGGFYAGQPLLVTANDYDLGVFNGDIGVVVARGEGLAAVDRAGRGAAGGGSQSAGRGADRVCDDHSPQPGQPVPSVSVILPDTQSPLLTRQLLYTAITRAQQQVRIVGSAEAVAAAVSRQVRRASGLTV